LPKGIERKLINLHQKFEIFFGAYDFIVDPKGEYFFLEVNPSGQWLWMEEKLNLTISESVAEALMNRI
jgi:D-alanine-D-alanine ligase-like ATP-grasp enzyme